jgi:hypothetical protein
VKLILEQFPFTVGQLVKKLEALSVTRLLPRTAEFLERCLLAYNSCGLGGGKYTGIFLALKCLKDVRSITLKTSAKVTTIRSTSDVTLRNNYSIRIIVFDSVLIPFGSPWAIT